MLKVSSITRSRDIMVGLEEAEEEYAYLDDPCNVRYIIWAGTAHLGYLRVYKTDPNNIAIQYGDALFGYQDTTRNIINRANANAIMYDNPVDLSDIIS